MSKITVNKSTYTVEPLYQWDLNQELEVYGLSLARVPEVHFTNAAMSRAIVRQATMDAAGVIRADIPNSLLQKPYTVSAYICTYEGATFETQYKLEIPVKARQQPADYTLVDDPEVYSFNALENQVTNALVAMNTAKAEMNTAKADMNTAKVALVAHANNKNNPHGVTAAQVGAAPAGFGYGETPRQFVYTSDTDGTVFINGIQSFVDGLVSGRQHIIAFQDYPYLPEVSFIGTIVRTGTAVRISGTSYTGASVQRIYGNDTGWGPWEYVNPPMRIGVEHRTTERYQGRPVYVKLVDCGAMVDGKRLETNIANIYEVVRYSAHHGGAVVLPYNNTSEYLIVSKTDISMRCSEDYWGGTVVVTLYYTKTTD